MVAGIKDEQMASSSGNSGFRQAAIDKLQEASEATESGHTTELLQFASTMALLAIADELGGIRGQLDAVESALTDQDGFGPGAHLRYVNDWLEKIADRMR